ncbi:MAG: hypothetical protein BGP23_12865 [Lysobacterales bacterium 66-474]|nr:MAG: hypothetical protein ABT18_04725 [Rhodanobacter sp. SCN 66-43]OJY87024.1 MAG: hypothetical protein BGP23_12865 [Xanthomonadales bacterium 66-474]
MARCLRYRHNLERQPEVECMQAILIMLPILAYAAIAGAMMFYVLFVLLPRMRRGEKPRGPHARQ